MNINEDTLRRGITALAEPVEPMLDPLPGIERKAHALGRRRVAAAIGATAAIAAVAALVVPAAAGLGGTRGRERVITPAGPSATASSTPARTPTPTATAADPAFARWPYLGDHDLEAAATETDFGSVTMAAARQALPGDTPTGRAWMLWGGQLGPHRVGVLLDVVEMHDAGGVRYLTVAYVRGGSHGYAVTGSRVRADATEVSLALPAGPQLPQSYVIIVGAPGTGAISYAADGRHFQPAEQRPGYLGSIGPTGEGWAIFPRTAGTGDAIEVWSAGDGRLRYRGPVGGS
jgi:hypothetical protein